MVTTSLKGVVTELGKIPKLAPHMGWGGALKLKGGQALQSFWGSVSGKIMTVTAALLALKAVWDYFNDKNGFTFDNYDDGGLMWGIDEAMRFYLKPEPFRSKVVARVMEEARKRFNYDVTAQEYIKIYESMLDRPLVDKIKK